MRMDDERDSRNVEDRRGRGGGSGFPGGRVAAGGGIGAVIIAVIVMLLGGDPAVVLEGGRAPSSTEQAARAPARTAEPGGDAEARFVSRVLASTEDVWTAEFRRNGREYEVPRLVLFSGAVQSGCGGARAEMGPFYCPADRRVYIDLAFFREMQRKLGAGGDFAQAYVIAHEVGHHVQQLLGILPRTTEIQQRAGRNSAESNAISVRVELQADCLAGFWARRAQEMRGILERGDVEEGLNAAAAVGDDRMMAGHGSVSRESFTHGSSRERVGWFRRGLEAPDVGACNTFG